MVLRMRVLLIHALEFKYIVRRKLLENVENVPLGTEFSVENASIAFIHILKEDEKESPAKLVRKLRKIVAWHARQLSLQNIVLHSFTHLAEGNSASPDFAKEILLKTAEKLKDRGFNVHVTPFGYLLELNMIWSANDFSRVFKEI